MTGTIQALPLPLRRNRKTPFGSENTVRPLNLQNRMPAWTLL